MLHRPVTNTAFDATDDFLDLPDGNEELVEKTARDAARRPRAIFLEAMKWKDEAGQP